MNRKVTMALFSAVFAVTISLAGTNGLFATAFVTNPSTVLETSSTNLVGHITATLYDSEGNIKQYVQTDNTVMIEGKDCIGKLAFNGPTGTEGCDNDAAKFDQVAIGKYSAGDCSGNGQPGDTFSGFDTEIDRASQDSASITQAVSAGAGAKILVSKQFSFSSSDTVQLALLANDASPASDDILAAQCFSDIPVDNGDSLTVEWEITVG